MFGAVLPGKLGIDQHGRDIHSRSNLLGCSPPAPTCWNTELCLSKRKYLSQVLSYTPVGARTRPWDLPARRSLCSIWVTFARDKTSPNYTSRVQRPHPTGLISAPNGARQAGSPPGMRSWMSRDNAGITPGCGSNLTGSWRWAQPSQNPGIVRWAARVIPLKMPFCISPGVFSSPFCHLAMLCLKHVYLSYKIQQITLYLLTHLWCEND